MRHFYISSKQGSSGIYKYAHDFYELILKEKGYEFIDSNEPVSWIRSVIRPNDCVHIELGIFQVNELAILFALLKDGYVNIVVTLHDPPLLKYPFYGFRNNFLNKVSKFYDIYINQFRNSKKYISRIKTIYVLSQKGCEEVQARYHVKNVYYLPHIVNEIELFKKSTVGRDFIYLGFIGRNKGIEYALQLHRRLLASYPEIKFYIAGTALGKELEFYNELKNTYKLNVYFLDYVTEEKLAELFALAGFSFILFKKYRFFSPVSGSVLYNLKKGNIVFTNSVNAIPEIVKDGKNGFYLSGDFNKDIRIVSEVLKNEVLQDSVREYSYKYLLLHHAKSAVERGLQHSSIS